jgi:hypothetical protein
MYGLEPIPYTVHPASRREAVLSRDLGVFTWAQLQATYPNGSGALAALPAGATAFVSDWAAEFAPNAARTVWRPIAPVLLAALTTDVTQTDAVTTEVLAWSGIVPAKLAQPGGEIQLLVWASAPSNAANRTVRLRAHTSAAVGGTIAGGANITTNPGLGLDGRWACKTATTKRFNNSASGFLNTAGAAGDITIDTDANDLYAIVTLQVAATGVSATVNAARLIYHPGSAA